jgi:hypothetical protein
LPHPAAGVAARRWFTRLGEMRAPRQISRQVVRVEGIGQNLATYEAPVVQPHVLYGGVGASYACTVPAS